MIYAEGNNREAIKFRLVEIPVVFGPSLPFYGRYNLPEIPEIDNSEIVGMGIAIRDNNNTISTASPLNLNFFIEGTIATNGTISLYQQSLISIKDKEGNILIDQFPMTQLINGAFIPGNRLFKVTSFNFTNISTKNSFITILNNNNVPPLTTTVIVYNIIFYYKDK